MSRAQAPARRMRPSLAAACLALALAGCAAEAPPIPTAPAFSEDLSKPGTRLDAAAAEELISNYRRKNGLQTVTLDPKLTAIAQAQAKAMAEADRLSHDIPGHGGFPERLRAGGYDAVVAGENVGAGYRTLTDAFNGWRNSPGHNANMLLKGASRMGIAIAHAPGTRYKVYWALALAAPDAPRRPVAGGPFLWGVPIKLW